MLRLLDKQLIQVDTRSSKSIENASNIRITSAGWYYHKYLVRSFAYLDLVFQDTPFNNEQMAKDLRETIVELDKLNDLQENVLQRMNLRFGRVERLFDYLSSEEEQEFKKHGLNQISGILSERIISSIKEQYQSEKDYILRRVSENLDNKEEEDIILDNLIIDCHEENSKNNLDIENQR
jgi:hypothetical protein